MNLQTALNAAKSSLLANAAGTALVSRNLAGANDANYSRRTLVVETGASGEVGVGAIARATDAALRDAALDAGSTAATNEVVAAALASLQGTVGDLQSASSPAALVGALQSALTQAAAAPQDPGALESAVVSARRMADALNSANATIQGVRADADAAMRASVDKLQSALNEFADVNAKIVLAKATGADASDALDRRDALLVDISHEVGVRAIAAPDGGIAIFTDSGVPLFQGAPRQVTMAPGATPTAASGGEAVYVDGVAVIGGGATMPVKSGALAGAVYVRDVATVKYQAQVDELARGMIEAFAQQDMSSAPTAPDRTGLFTWSGAPALPAAAVKGLSGEISLDPSVDPTAGGNVALLRDGGIGAGAPSVYVYNREGGASYTERLIGLADALDVARPFDPSAGLGASLSVADFAIASASWLEQQRQASSDDSARSDAIAAQAKSALGNAVGVNIDDQMALMLGLEHSYQASAKIMATVDTMYSALFNSLTGTR